MWKTGVVGTVRIDNITSHTEPTEVTDQWCPLLIWDWLLDNQMDECLKQHLLWFSVIIINLCWADIAPLWVSVFTLMKVNERNKTNIKWSCNDSPMRPIKISPSFTAQKTLDISTEFRFRAQTTNKLERWCQIHVKKLFVAHLCGCWFTHEFHWTRGSLK